MQLPLQVWASLHDFIENEMASIPVIAEHCASVTLPLDASSFAAFETVCMMLRKGLIFVKLGALHGRVAGKSSDELHKVMSTFADAGPEQLLWGSDWPHVNSNARGLAEADFLEVDEMEELDTLQRAMSEVTFQKMMCSTPTLLFGC